MNTDHIKVDKYEVVIKSGDNNFEFYALRNGEMWIPNLINVEASNLIMSFAYEIQRLRSKNELLINENKLLTTRIED